MKNSRVKILAPLGRYFTGNKINQTIVNSCIKHLPAVSDDLVSTNWAQLRQAPCSPGRAGLPDLPNEGARCAPQAPLHKGTEHIMVTGGTLRYISLLCRRTCITAWALPFYFHHIVVVFFSLCSLTLGKYTGAEHHHHFVLPILPLQHHTCSAPGSDSNTPHTNPASPVTTGVTQNRHRQHFPFPQ